jgi:hypothetical protein
VDFASELVGRTDALFADDAIARLHKLSLGLPRALNNAAIAALIAAATAGKALVDDDCAKRPLRSSLMTEPAWYTVARGAVDGCQRRSPSRGPVCDRVPPVPYEQKQRSRYVRYTSRASLFTTHRGRLDRV